MRPNTSSGATAPGAGRRMPGVRAAARWALLAVTLFTLLAGCFTGAAGAAQAGKPKGETHHTKHHTAKKKKKRALALCRKKAKKVKGKRHRARVLAKCKKRVAARHDGAKKPAAQPAPAAPGAPTSAPAAPAPNRLIAESFDGDGPFVTKSAFWGTADQGAKENPRWFAESGNLTRQGGTGAVKEPTFRMWTRRHDLQDIRVDMDLKVNGLPNLRGNSESWDGVKFWLRRQLCTPEPSCNRLNDPNSQAGYTAEVGLRDGRVYIQKKVGHVYRLLAAASTKYPIPYGSWMKVGGVVRNNADGSVTIQVLRQGKVLVEYTDHGVGGAPLRAEGRLGLRADNVDMNVDNLTISPAG